MKRLITITALLLAGNLFGQIPGLSFTPIPIEQPRMVNPTSIAAGSGGRIWFTDLTFKQVGFFDSNRSVHRFKLIDSVDPTNEVRPLFITEGGDGNGWFTLYVTNSSGSPLNRSAVAKVILDGSVTIYPLPTGNACRGFFGLPDCGITKGPDGNVWFVETQTKKVGKITMAGGITEFTLNFPGVSLYDITAGPDGNLWATDQVRNQGTIWRITPQGTATEFAVPGTNTSPFRITAGPDGNVWFTASGINSVGRITPAGTITLHQVPVRVQRAGLGGIATGPDGNIWFTESDDLQIGRVNPSTGMIDEAPAPAGQKPFEVITLNDRIVVSTADARGDITLHEAVFAAPPPAKAPKLRMVKGFRGADYTRVGAIFTVELLIYNDGDADALNWKMIDVFPDCLEFVKDIRPVNVVCSPSAGTVTCNGPPEKRALGARGDVIVLFEVRVKKQGVCTNLATLTADGAAPATGTAETTAFDPREVGAARNEEPSTADVSGRFFGPGKKD